jgi:hypothetical protein
MPHVNDLHEQHDPLLVVSLASGDLATDDRVRADAQSLVENCADCARLHDDVLALARATKALPPAIRPRDFQISPQQAARLRPAGWRRFVAGLAGPGSPFSRQLGVGLATLGIAGLLIGALPSVQLGLGGSAAASAAPSAPAAGAPAFESSSQGAALLPAPQASAAPSAGALTGVAGGDTSASTSPNYGTNASSKPIRVEGDGSAQSSAAASQGSDRALEAPSATDRQGAATPAGESSGSGPSGLVIVSTALLFAGVLVLLVRSLARRAAAT